MNFKQLALTALFTILATPAALAQAGLGISTSGSSSNAGSSAGANNNLTFNNPATVHNKQSGSVRTSVPGIAPNLVASAVGTCLGSAGAGIGLTGVGLSFGSTYPDKNCDRRMYSASLLAVGQRNAATAILCKNLEVYQAFAAVGVNCPLLPDGYQVATPAAVAQVYAQPVAPARYASPSRAVASVDPAHQRELEGARAAAIRIKAMCKAEGGSNC